MNIMVNETYTNVITDADSKYFSPVNIYNNPKVFIQIYDLNGQEIYKLYDVQDITIKNVMEHSIDEQGSVGLSNTATLTVPNTNGIAWEKIKQDYPIVIYGDYLDEGEKAFNKNITGPNGTRTMKRLFTGYIDEIPPSFNTNGHFIKLICKNTIFHYNRVYSKGKTYRGKLKDEGNKKGSISKFMDDNGITTVKVNLTEMANVKANVEIKDMTVYEGFDKFRRDIAHFAFIDENGVLWYKPFEQLYATAGQQYWQFNYGETLISATIPSYKKMVNTVIVYYSRKFDESKKVTVSDPILIERYGEEISRKYFKRDINNYNDAYKFAQNKLRSLTKSNIGKCTIPFFPYITLGQFFEINYPFSRYHCLFLCDGITHSMNNTGWTTELHGFATLINSVSEELVKNKRKTLLEVTKG